MTDQFEIEKELEPSENITGEDPEIGRILSAPKKRKRKKIRTLIFRALILIYFILVIFSGYWYWFQPVRSDQIYLAYKWWKEIARTYDIPIPSDTRWD